jgi:hypothetical protein
VLRGLGPIVATIAVVAVFGAMIAAGASSNDRDENRHDVNELDVEAQEYRFVLEGHLRPGWGEVHFVNQGIETHEMAILRVKPEVTTDQLSGALASGDDATVGALLDGSPDATYGGPAPLDPQQESDVVTLLRPGHYALVCFVMAPDGTPHFANGMVEGFSVSGIPARTGPPDDDFTVELNDGAINGVRTILGGDETVLVINKGATNHSLQLVKLDAGKTIDDAIAYFGAKFAGVPTEGEAPGALVGGAGELRAGQSTYVVLDLEPGRYGYVSTAGQGSDAASGMKGEFRVR